MSNSGNPGIETTSIRNDKVDLAKYYERIGFSGKVDSSLKTLSQLHLKHTLSIPFENINQFLRQPVSLDILAIQEKLVTKRRGGYCLEQNLLFSKVLQQLGFKVKELAGRVLWQLPEDKVNAQTHMLLLVEVEGNKYIADVGFAGVTLTTPLLLKPEIEQKTSHDIYRLAETDEEYILEVKIGQEWKPIYSFSTQKHYQEDYEVIHFYLTNHRDSKFINNLIIGATVPDGRYVLYNNVFTRYTISKKVEKRTLTGYEDFLQVLDKKIKLSPNQISGLEKLWEELSFNKG